MAAHFSTVVGHWLARCGQRHIALPGLGLVALAMAWRFGDNVLGTIGVALLAATVGMALCFALPKQALWPAWLPHLPHGVGALVIVVTGLVVYRDGWQQSPDWLAGDWAVQHAVLADAQRAGASIFTSWWDHAVSTGDAPYETYPSLSYGFAQLIAVVFGWTHDLLRALTTLGVIAHIAIALAIASLTRMMAPAWVATVVGLAAVLDLGGLSDGGAHGIFGWGLLHNAVAQAFALWLAVAGMRHMRLPTHRNVVAIWLLAALATAVHPSGLLHVALYSIGSLVAAALTTQHPRRYALMTAVHLWLGTAAGAVVWLPFALRNREYGQHFATVARPAERLLLDALNNQAITSSVGVLIALGTVGIWLGVRNGIAQRQPQRIFIAVTAGLALWLLSSQLYLAFDLLTSPTGVRVAPERFRALARPFLLAGGGMTFASLLQRGTAALPATQVSTRQPSRWALAAILLVATIRPAYNAIATHVDTVRTGSFRSAPDRASREQLLAWAAAANASVPKPLIARAMIEADDQHFEYELTARTGLPVFHLYATPNLLLANRMEGTDAQSLARFNVRWAIARGRSPTVGDPASEQRVGNYYIRTIPEWTGQLVAMADATVDAGAGLGGGTTPAATVQTLAVTSRAVSFTVQSSQPVEVAFGLGDYPRWQLFDAAGQRVALQRQRATADATSFVPSATLAAGTYHLRFTGALPSDHAGRPLAWLACLAMTLGIALTRWRARFRMWRWWAGTRARLQRHCDIVRGAAMVALALSLLVGAKWLTGRPTAAIIVGSGVTATASVQAKVGAQPWQPCAYQALAGIYLCPEVVAVHDGIANAISDDSNAWPYPTAAIVATPLTANVQVRISLPVNLQGRYRVAATQPTELAAGYLQTTIDQAARVNIPTPLGAGTTLTLQVTDVGTSRYTFTMVHEDALQARP